MVVGRRRRRAHQHRRRRILHLARITPTPPPKQGTLHACTRTHTDARECGWTRTRAHKRTSHQGRKQARRRQTHNENAAPYKRDEPSKKISIDVNEGRTGGAGINECAVNGQRGTRGKADQRGKMWRGTKMPSAPVRFDVANFSDYSLFSILYLFFVFSVFSFVRSIHVPHVRSSSTRPLPPIIH